MPNLPNSVKIKNLIIISEYKIKILISFWNAFNLYSGHFELFEVFGVKVNILAKFGKIISEKLE